MAQTLESTALTEDERAVVEAFGAEQSSTAAQVIRSAARQRSDVGARAAYWALVAGGVLVLTGAGSVKLARR